jgi:hypothetical protein
VRNVQVEIFVPVATKNTAGQIIRYFGYQQNPVVAANTTITAQSVQPKTFTQAELAAFGISDRATNAKTMYSLIDSTYLKIGNRARVASDKIYDIFAIQEWEQHAETLLLPCVGE